MKAVTWQGVHDMRVIEVPDPRIEEPTDAIIKITSTALCGSDLHLYETLGPFMEAGDVVGHEPMGIVQEVGSGVTNLQLGDRVVVPFNVCCGTAGCASSSCTASARPPRTTSTAPAPASSATRSSTARSPAARRSTCGCRSRDFLPVKVPEGPADDRFLFLSDVLPTAWQAVEYADVPDGGTLLVLGAGPIGDMAARMGVHAAHRVISVDRVPERLARVERHGAEVIDLDDATSRRRGRHRAGVDRRPRRRRRHRRGGHGGARLPGAAARPEVRRPAARRGRRADDEEGRRGPPRRALHRVRGRAPRRHGLDRRRVRRAADPIPMLQLFDKQMQIRMGQANVRAGSTTLPLLEDGDPWDVESFATHHLPLERGPGAYEHFQEKEEGMVKVVFKP